MHITISSNDLKRMAKLVSTAVDPRSPKFANVELSRMGDVFALRATNGSLHVKAMATVGADFADGDEAVLMDGETLKKIAGSMIGEVTISTDGKALTFKANGRTKTPIIEGTIPEMEMDGTESESVAAAELSDAINRVLYAVSTDETRMVLTGIRVETGPDGMTLIGLDGFRLAQSHCKTVTGRALPGITIPGNTAKVAAAALSDGGSATIRAGEKRVRITTPGAEITATLLAGEYIDWKRILPKDGKTRALVRVKELRELLQGCAVADEGGKNNLVKLTVGDDKLTVRRNSVAVDYDGTMECETDGDPLTIAFNSKYLMDVINTTEGDEITMDMSTPVSPAVIRDSVRMDEIRLVLPVRVQE